MVAFQSIPVDFSGSHSGTNRFTSHFDKIGKRQYLSDFEASKGINMGQRLPELIAEAEAERLLQLALALLDESRNFVVSAYVAQALIRLAPIDVACPAEDFDGFGQPAAFAPSWGVLVEK